MEEPREVLQSAVLSYGDYGQCAEVVVLAIVIEMQAEPPGSGVYDRVGESVGSRFGRDCLRRGDLTRDAVLAYLCLIAQTIRTVNPDVFCEDLSLLI